MKTKTLFLSFVFFVCIGIHAQNVITVDNSPGANAQYDNLPDAITAAADGDILYVHASETNYGVITINKPLSLIGYSHSSEDRRTKITRITINTGITGVTIKGVHVTDTGTSALVVSGSSSSEPLENFVLENNKIDGSIRFQGSGADNVLIRGNVMRQIGFTSSTSASQFTNTIITNNIVYSVITVVNYNSVEIKNNVFLGTRGVHSLNTEGDLIVQDCIFYHNTSIDYNPNRDGLVFQHCLSYNASGTTTPLGGTNNIDDQDPLWVNPSDDFTYAPLSDYNLQPSSPAIDAGVSGNDIGLFTGVPEDFMFNNLGFSQGIPTVSITAITNTVAPGGTLDVTIESNSN